METVGPVVQRGTGPPCTENTTSHGNAVCFKEAFRTADGYLASVCWCRPGCCEGMHVCAPAPLMFWRVFRGELLNKIVNVGQQHPLAVAKWVTFTDGSAGRCGTDRCIAVMAVDILCGPATTCHASEGADAKQGMPCHVSITKPLVAAESLLRALSLYQDCGGGWHEQACFLRPCHH